MGISQVQVSRSEKRIIEKLRKKRRKIKESYKIRQRQHTTVKRSGFTEKCSEKESDHMMEDGNGRKKVWICLSIVVLAAVVIGAVYYMNMPKEHSEEGFFNPERKRGLCGWHQGKRSILKAIEMWR